MALTDGPTAPTAHARPWPGPPAGPRSSPPSPLTRFVAALAGTTLAILAGGVVLPLLVLGAALAAAAGAGRTRSVVRDTLLLALPVGLAAAALSLLIYPEGTTTLAVLGPFRVTAEGARVAAVTLARIVAIAATIAAFVRTTGPDLLVADLTRRGLPPRLTFPVAAAATALPATVARVRAITAAQRMRGMDTEGSIGRRLRGVLPVLVPALLGTLEEVEARTLALEARAFARPGPRAVLWAPSEARGERLLRLGLVLLVPAVLLLPAAGIRLP